MTNEIIDVDYRVVSSDEDNKPDKQPEPDITINADPLSALISGVCGIINHITDAAKEYGQCKQQEQTKRAEIKAKMKVELERINAQKEILTQYQEQDHTAKMALIQASYQRYQIVLQQFTDAIHAAIESAKESGDFSGVCSLLECEHGILRESSEIELKIMESSGQQQLPGVDFTGFLGMK